MLFAEVRQDCVADVWEYAEPFLAKAARFHPFTTTDGILRSLLLGNATLFIGGEDDPECAVVLEVQSFASGQRVANVWAVGGVPGALAKYHDIAIHAIEQWSRDNHCDTIAFAGRPGWAKALRGFRMQPYVLAWRPTHEDLPGSDAVH